MTIRLDEAITTALEFEKNVLRLYQGAEAHVVDPVGRKVFATLAAEEAGHVAYLQSRLGEWRRSGHITLEELRTAVPDKARIAQGRTEMPKPARDRAVASPEAAYLQQAVVAERETSDFYRRMVSELAEDSRTLFARFLEIEEGHLALVEAELDSVNGAGFWFGLREFDLEAG